MVPPGTRHGLDGLSVDLRAIALIVTASACLIHALPTLPSLLWFVPPLVLCLWRFPGRSLLAVCLLTCAWTTFLAHQHLANRLPAADNGTTREMHGTVTGLPEPGSMRTRFMFRADQAPHRPRLSWYGDVPELHPGDCYDLTVKLFAPHGSANPGNFDYETWLWRRGVDATGYVKKARPCPDVAFATVDAWRQQVVAAIGTALGQHPMRGIIEALTVGVTQRIDSSRWRVFRRTGTTHLVAISGLHIGIVGGWLMLLARWLLLRLPWRLPVLSVSALIGLGGGAFYALLAGLGLPSLRAVLMLGIGMLALTMARHVSFGRMLALAAIVVVLWHPVAVLSPGFWLSFGAVAWIVYLGRMLPRNRIRAAMRLQLGISLGLIPLTLYFFGQASLISPLTNMVLIPLAGLYVPVVLLAVLATVVWPALGAPCLQLCANLLQAAWPLWARMAEWPMASVQQPAPGLMAVALALLGIALLFAPRGWPGRWLAAILVLPLLIGWQPPGQGIVDGGYRLSVLDVGHGLATVVRTKNHVLVYDAGPRYRTGFNAGSAIVAPYLRHARIDHVDMLMISHADMDHIGGADAVMQAMPVAQRTGAGSQHPCQAGQHWQWDSVRFRVLYPYHHDARAGTNDNSCVLRIAGAGGVTLLTGDIESPSEHELVKHQAAALAADVLVVPHHGSKSSSTPAFVKAVSPRYALVSSAWQGRWHFPADQVVARYRQAGTTVWDTATSGAIRVDLMPGEPIAVHRWRVTHPTWWQIPQPLQSDR